ncbi:hypothetical protein [Nocardia brasiliensis]|uniref:hypothetical protein n=1 Tax=Nocardia brasiliensis TaxID=37326 RepID=UPI0033E099BE
MPSVNASQDGLEYKVIVSVPGSERTLAFYVDGMSRLPRPGEGLDFDGPDSDNLCLRVTEVRHSFSHRSPSGARVYAVLDHERSDPEHLAVMHRLLAAPELKRWTGTFPMLRPDESTAAYVNGMRAVTETQGKP